MRKSHDCNDNSETCGETQSLDPLAVPGHSSRMARQSPSPPLPSLHATIQAPLPPVSILRTPSNHALTAYRITASPKGHTLHSPSSPLPYGPRLPLSLHAP